MKLRHGLVSATALIALVGAAMPVKADTTADLLLRLKEKGILTEDEYQALLTRRTEETKAATPAAAATTGSTAQVSTAVAPVQDAQTAAASALDDKRVVRIGENGGMDIGGVNIKITGSVNGFYTHDSGQRASPTTTVVGGVATVGSKDTSSIRNGLLPGYFKLDVTTTQLGIDVGAHFGLYPGINSVDVGGGSNANSGGSPNALGSSGIDARQTYLTFGTKKFGEVKIGRDIGLFGSEGLLNDITLLTVGTAAGNAAPSNTSLGRIGVGYIYADWQPQITYTSPLFAGVQLAVGAFTPLETAGRSEVNSQPGFQAKLTYDYKDGPFAARAWLSGISQKHDAVDLLPSYTGRAFDTGAKLTYGPASIVGYYYNGKGVGTTGLFLLSTDAFGVKRKSNGFYAQGTMEFGKVTLAGSYGESNLDLADGEINPTLVSKNSSYVGQIRYGLTPWVTLITEYTHTMSDAHGENSAKSNTIATGAILFF